MIEFERVSKSYNKGQVKAVDELTLTVRPGEIFGFLGPNGAGKTTTIKLIVGLLKPDAGTDPRRTASTSRMSRPVQSRDDLCPGHAGRLRAADRPRIPQLHRRRLRGPQRRPAGPDRKMARHLRALLGAVSSPIQSYSHGMKQKIVLIAALLPAPRVMVLDEPMVGLDPRAAHHLKELMREHCDKGGTLFFSTHIMEVAEKLCDRIGIIDKGRLIACGTMDELKQIERGAVAREDLPGADREMTQASRPSSAPASGPTSGCRVLAYRFFTEKKDRWLLPLIALAGLGLGPTLFGYLKLLDGLYGMLASIGPAGRPADLRPPLRADPHPPLRPVLRHLGLLFLPRPGDPRPPPPQALPGHAVEVHRHPASTNT